jgi:Sec-independent protein translocase protein TatA
MIEMTEIILIFVVILLMFIAPRQIADIARSFRRGIRAFREETTGMGIEPSEHSLVVFVSSMISELSNERKAIRQAIQQIPLTKPWLFEFTPPSPEKLDESYLNKVKECDIFILVIGKSISLAVKQEFEWAKSNRKSCLIFLKECERTEEAQTFVNSIPFKWAKFFSIEELANLVQLSLIDELIRGYREGSQKKLSPEHLTILVSAREVLAARKSETVLEQIANPSIADNKLTTTPELKPKYTYKSITDPLPEPRPGTYYGRNTYGVIGEVMRFEQSFYEGDESPILLLLLNYTEYDNGRLRSNFIMKNIGDPEIVIHPFLDFHVGGDSKFLGHGWNCDGTSEIVLVPGTQTTVDICFWTFGASTISIHFRFHAGAAAEAAVWRLRKEVVG